MIPSTKMLFLTVMIGVGTYATTSQAANYKVEVDVNCFNNSNPDANNVRNIGCRFEVFDPNQGKLLYDQGGIQLNQPGYEDGCRYALNNSDAIVNTVLGLKHDPVHYHIFSAPYLSPAGWHEGYVCEDSVSIHP